jgi:hypothetical protein
MKRGKFRLADKNLGEIFAPQKGAENGAEA